MDNITMALKLYEQCKDMDYNDYAEEEEKEIIELANQINSIKGSILFSCIETLLEII